MIKRLLNTSAIVAVLLYVISPVLYGQGEPGQNPNYDRIPDEYLQRIVPTLPPLRPVVTAGGYDNYNIGTAQAEPHISVNPRNPLQIFTAFNINAAFRTQNAYDWTAFTPNFGTTMAGDPVTAYDSLGNLYYSNMYGSITGAKVMKSTDNGITFAAAQTGVLGADKNWIACDQTGGPYANYIYNTMTSATAGSGNFWRSTDGGLTYTQTATFSTQALPGMMVAVGPNTASGQNISGGCVYVVTHSGTNAAGTYTFYLSTDGGATFNLKSTQQFSNLIGTQVSGRSTVNGMRTRPYPMIAADNSYGPYRGRLYLVYASNDPVGDGMKPDIFARYSTDQGATWSAALRVNDDPAPTLNHSFFPAIWCDKETGRLFVKFYCSRLVATSDSMDVYATYSDDGGQTFAPNQRITNASFKTKLSSSGTAPAYQGDYDAINSYKGQATLVWTDFRANGYGCYVAFFPDYAMTTNVSAVEMRGNNDVAIIRTDVPSVKLYTGKVKFTTEISPAPTIGNFVLSFQGADSLTTFPGNVSLRVNTQNVAPGTYTLTITGTGNYGITVHKRTVTIVVNSIIPVELTAFNGESTSRGVELNWSTATETNNKGFSIERVSLANPGKWETLGFISGKGTTTEKNNYRFVDANTNSAGTYTYRLKQVDLDGSFTYSNIVNVDITAIKRFALDQNYPNPFNPSTAIKFFVPSQSKVRLAVYNVTGQQVALLVNEVRNAGEHQEVFHSGNLPSGIYYYELTGNGFSDRKKMMLVK